MKYIVLQKRKKATIGRKQKNIVANVSASLVLKLFQEMFAKKQEKYKKSILTMVD